MGRTGEEIYHAERKKNEGRNSGGGGCEGRRHGSMLNMVECILEALSVSTFTLSNFTIFLEEIITQY
jgi:hypothetical protein